MGSVAAFAAVESVLPVEAKKVGKYVTEGLYVTGDSALDDVVVTDIRHAANPQHERVVIDFQANKQGDGVAISRLPYVTAAVSPELKRVEVTVFGKPKLAFDPKKVRTLFRKSKVVESVDLLPVVERDRWTFVMNFRGEDAKVEVFQLRDPLRLIVDLKK